MGTRRTLVGLALSISVLAAMLAAPASGLQQFSPVKCAGDEITPDGRVFPEPRVSTNFLRFDEFECGVALLERRYPHLIETTVVGTSEDGHNIYNVLLTDERRRAKKPKLLVVSSIHGGEVGGREGAVRVIEDMVDPKFLGDKRWVREVLDRYVIHFLFPNPDGWVNGDVVGSPRAGVLATRGNRNGLDLNRQFPVKGWISTPNRTMSQAESKAIVRNLLDEGGWFLGTDNHGQGPDTYAAAGLQIVGQFDYQKSETLARFADGITQSMKQYGVLSDLETLRDQTGQDMGAYHWGTLYDMLGYSASGSLIDYYNTADGLDGTGFATELTIGIEANWAAYPAALNQVWVDSIRAINYTMFRQAVNRKRFDYEVGGRVAYVFDPKVIRHDDANGSGYERQEGEDIRQRPYRVTRMKFFTHLNRYATRKLAPVRVGEILRRPGLLQRYDSLVLANKAMPGKGNEQRYYRILERWVRKGGNLVLTDAALKALPELGLVEADAVTVAKHYVGSVEEFTDRSHPLNAGLRGVASQTYDTVPIGYQFGGTSMHSAPNWKVSQEAWEAAGGYTAGTNGDGQTIYGELPLGAGRVRILGALLPDPTEKYYHPYGLQSYAVTYTGYTLLQNMLDWDRDAQAVAVPAEDES